MRDCRTASTEEYPLQDLRKNARKPRNLKEEACREELLTVEMYARVQKTC
jgi:hypothetical protein